MIIAFAAGAISATANNGPSDKKRGPLKKSMRIEELSRTVNSKYQEIRPILSPDGKTLFFSRRKHPQNIGGKRDFEDIWYCEFDDKSNTWGPAKNIGEPLNNTGPNFVSSITSDGQVLLLGNQYLKKGKMKAGVSMSHKTESGWSKPVNLKIKQDYNYSNKAGYYLSSDKQVLIMSVEREDTRGGRDLYVSRQVKNGKWSKPINLGNQVNSRYTEEAPFLSEDGEALYFSSNKKGGFGDSDIYVSYRLDNSWTRWSKPQNLGKEVNSKHADLSFFIPFGSEEAFFTRNSDIYEIRVEELPTAPAPIQFTGKIASVLDGLVNKINIEIKDTETGQLIYNSEISESATFQAELPASNNIEILISGDDIIHHHESINISTIDTEHSFLLQTKYVPPIFFEEDKTEIDSESINRLKTLAKSINKIQGASLIISGYADSKGGNQYNLDLSQRRASRVASLLIQYGLEEE